MLCGMEELCVCRKQTHARVAQWELCVWNDTLLDMAWQPVHGWPQLKKDEVICIHSVSLSVQRKVLPTQKGSRACERCFCEASLREKNINNLRNKKKVPVDLEASDHENRGYRLINWNYLAASYRSHLS